jgi:hypothetical protein
VYILKLWQLDPIDYYSGPWACLYDTALGFIICAKDEVEAREIAHENAGDENDEGQTPWLNPKFSTCTQFTFDDTKSGVILGHYHIE